MNASDLMTSPARTCRANDACSAAARIMWEGDCGCVPITDDEGALLGVVTDRDLCMATYTTGMPLGAIPVAHAMSSPARTCRVTDSIETALETMRTHQLHRLPTVDAEGRLAGVLSLADLVQHHAPRAKGDEATVFQTLASICAPRTGAPASSQSTAPAAATPAKTEPVVAIQPTATPRTSAPSKAASPGTTAKPKTASKPTATGKPKATAKTTPPAKTTSPPKPSAAPRATPTAKPSAAPRTTTAGEAGKRATPGKANARKKPSTRRTRG